LHFTPTSASWLNLVEWFSRDLSQVVVLPGSFATLDELTDAIWACLAERNLQPHRYDLRPDGKVILEKIPRQESSGKLVASCERHFRDSGALSGTDSGVSTRTCKNALDAIVETKTGSTQNRWRRIAKETELDLIRDRLIVETQRTSF
jgi:hypothetical protein